MHSHLLAAHALNYTVVLTRNLLAIATSCTVILAILGIQEIMLKHLQLHIYSGSVRSSIKLIRSLFLFLVFLPLSSLIFSIELIIVLKAEERPFKACL